jgi:hypothetical protein
MKRIKMAAKNTMVMRFFCDLWFCFCEGWLMAPATLQSLTKNYNTSNFVVDTKPIFVVCENSINYVCLFWHFYAFLYSDFLYIDFRTT